MRVNINNIKALSPVIGGFDGTLKSYKQLKVTTESKNLNEIVEFSRAILSQNTEGVQLKELQNLEQGLKNLEGSVEKIKMKEAGMLTKVFIKLFPHSSRVKKFQREIQEIESKIQEMVYVVEGDEEKIYCKQMKLNVNQSQQIDDQFITSMIRKKHFHSSAKVLIEGFVKLSDEDPGQKCQKFKTNLDNMCNGFIKDQTSLPDGWQSDMMIAVIIAGGEVVDSKTFGQFKEFFTKEWDFSKKGVLSGMTSEYYIWSRMFIAFGGVHFLSKLDQVRYFKETDVHGRSSKEVGPYIAAFCNRAKSVVSKSANKDDQFIKKLIQNPEFVSRSKELVSNFVNNEENDPIRKMKFFREEFNKLAATQFKEEDKINDAWILLSKMAVILAASDGLNLETLGKFNEFFSKSWDFGREDPEYGYIKGEKTTEYFEWSQMQRALSAVQQLSRQ